MAKTRTTLIPATKLTPRVAAKLLEVSERTLRRWLAEDKIPESERFQTPGGRWLISRRWVDEYRKQLAASKVVPHA